MATTKTNYTAQEIATLTGDYTGQNNATEVAAIAKKLNRTEASVRSKLVQLQVYKKAPATAKKSSAGVQKLDIAQNICNMVGISPDVFGEGLAKANKEPLDRILNTLTAQNKINADLEQLLIATEDRSENIQKELDEMLAKE